MKVSTTLVAHILEKRGKSPEQISEGLAFYENIERTIKVANDKQREAHRKLEDEINIWKNKIKEAQQSCDHPLFTFHGDPSGNGDSFHCCDLCGKEW